jgi:hypothetical protein
MVTVQAAVFIDGHTYLSSKGVGISCLVERKTVGTSHTIISTHHGGVLTNLI